MAAVTMQLMQVSLKSQAAKQRYNAGHQSKVTAFYPIEMPSSLTVTAIPWRGKKLLSSGPAAAVVFLTQARLCVAIKAEDFY